MLAASCPEACCGRFGAALSTPAHLHAGLDGVGHSLRALPGDLRVPHAPTQRHLQCHQLLHIHHDTLVPSTWHVSQQSPANPAKCAPLGGGGGRGEGGAPVVDQAQVVQCNGGLRGLDKDVSERRLQAAGIACRPFRRKGCTLVARGTLAAHSARGMHSTHAMHIMHAAHSVHGTHFTDSMQQGTDSPTAQLPGSRCPPWL